MQLIEKRYIRPVTEGVAEFVLPNKKENEFLIDLFYYYVKLPVQWAIASISGASLTSILPAGVDLPGSCK